jgi:hypothetical protein
VDGVQIFWVNSMSLKHTGSEVALQRSKLQSVLFVTLEKELDQAIAESTDSVVQHD